MKLKTVLYIILSILVGELALVLLTTVAQEILFNGISYHRSTLLTILFGGLATFIAAGLAGALARMIYSPLRRIIPAIISLIIIIEMSYLISAGITGDPIWFDLLAGFGLVAGIWLGYHFREIFPQQFGKTVTN